MKDCRPVLMVLIHGSLAIFRHILCTTSMHVYMHALSKWARKLSLFTIPAGEHAKRISKVLLATKQLTVNLLRYVGLELYGCE